MSLYIESPEHPTSYISSPQIIQRVGGSVGEGTREVTVRIYSRTPMQDIGKRVQSSPSSHLTTSSFLLKQFLGICGPLPHIPQPLLLFPYSPRPSVAQLWPLHSPLKQTSDEYPIRGIAPASQALDYSNHFLSTKLLQAAG